MKLDDSSWRRNLITINSNEWKEVLPKYGAKTPEIGNNSRQLSELGILTSLALKCRNLILGDPNKIIPIPNKNRLIEINLS